MIGGWSGGQESAFLFSVSLNPLLSGSLNFSGSLVFFVSFVKFTKFTIFPGSAITAQGQAVNSSFGGEKNMLYIVYFAYSLFALSLSVLVFCLLP